MAYRQSVHIEAPAEKVFDVIRDPGTWGDLAPEDVAFGEVTLTPQGVGTRYTWTALIRGICVGGFGVFTEVVPGRRITDWSSSPIEGTWTYELEPDGSGTRLTVESRSRSFWGVPPLGTLLDRLAARTHDAVLGRLKALIEEQDATVPASGPPRDA